MELFLKTVVAVLSLYVLALAFIYIFQEKLIFQSVQLPAEYTFDFSNPFEEYFLKTTDNEKLNLIYFKSNVAEKKGLIIYFHGNADNLKRWGQYAVDFTNLGYDVLMPDYRGYGKSTGTPNEEALYADAEFIWNWAHEKFNYPEWVIYGRSLGAAVATHLATQTKPDLLFLETPFDDLNGASLAALIPFKLKYKFSNKERLRSIECKKMIFHGTQDWIVPLPSAMKLKPLIKENDRFVIIPGGGHKNLRDFPIYHENLKEFLAE